MDYLYKLNDCVSIIRKNPNTEIKMNENISIQTYMYEMFSVINILSKRGKIAPLREPAKLNQVLMIKICFILYLN